MKMDTETYKKVLGELTSLHDSKIMDDDSLIKSIHYLTLMMIEQNWNDKVVNEGVKS